MFGREVREPWHDYVARLNQEPRSILKLLRIEIGDDWFKGMGVWEFESEINHLSQIRLSQLCDSFYPENYFITSFGFFFIETNIRRSFNHCQVFFSLLHKNTIMKCQFKRRRYAFAWARLTLLNFEEFVRHCMFLEIRSDQPFYYFRA